MLKKGAMFGLDARIALAIFGALSVISGAALYSAIQNAKAVATISELKELTKSLESFYIDTASIPELYDSFNYIAKSNRLIENNSIPGWRGPYSPLQKHPTTENLRKGNGNDYHIAYLKSNLDWSTPTTTEACDSSNICYSWARVYDHAKTYSESIKLSIDQIIDNADGANKGNFRWDNNSINLKGIAVPSLN